MFDKLSVWFDTKNKGITDAGELIELNKLNVEYIDLKSVSDPYKHEESGARKEKTSFV